MTFRDKVQKECPEAINERALGGVTGCPCHYGYEKDQPMLCSIFSDGMLTCTNCWNREMPEPENGRERKMTFREKLMKEHKESIGVIWIDGCKGCPCAYGYEERRPKECGYTLNCKECWDREIPGTEETKGDNRKIDVETVADGIMIIADHYGIENQKKKLIEEMGELIQAVCKDDLPGIIEECADVKIMLHQIAYLLGISKNVSWAMEQKVERQLERIRMEVEG